MSALKNLILVTLLFSIELVEYVRGDNSGDYKVVGYLGSWANYRDGEGKFVIEDIDPFLFTHLIYAFAKLENNKIQAYDPYLDLKENWGLGAFERFNALKKKNPGLSTLIAIGGWGEGSTKYSQMASNPQSRKVFIDSCIEFLKKYGFSGIDMDWEYPANRGGSPSDKQNFVLLLKEMKEALQPHGYLLTAAVSAGQSIIDTAYDIPGMSRYLDFINLMAYDFHGGWEQKTGFNAPLYSRSGESDAEKKLNVDYAVKYWLKNGTPAKKLVLGMGLYGRSFTLQNTGQNGIGAPAVGNGNAGPFTRENGMLGYNEICRGVDSGSGWTAVFDEEQKATYAYKDRQWVGYDDKKSIGIKVNYIKKMNLGGGMVWSIETDDFRGLCGGQRYPLLNIIKTGLNGDRRPDPTQPPHTTDKLVPSTTGFIPTTTTAKPNTPSSSVCTEQGFVRNPNDCKKFYYCQKDGSSKYTVFEYNCAPGTVFSNKIKTCTYPSEVPECQK